MRKLSRHARRYWQPVAAVAVVNFLLFAVASFRLGGDALNGGIEGGRYYLDNHGRRTEVGRAVYTYSFVHAASVVGTHGLTMGWAAVMIGRGRFYEPRPVANSPEPP